jgi:hypothetical protein
MGAVSFHTLTTESERVSYPDWLSKWNDLQNPMVCTSSDTLADWKEVIETLCSIENRCDYLTPKQQSELKSFFHKVDELKTQRKAGPSDQDPDL